MYEVTVAAGTLRSEDGITMPHRWTDAGVSISAEFTGAHLLHLAAAGCVLNDIYREAAARSVQIDGVRVTADGNFEDETWQSNGIIYSVEVDSPAPADELAAVVVLVDEIAEIPRALRLGTTVRRG